MRRLATATHSSQIVTRGPATSLATSASVFLQNEQHSLWNFSTANTYCESSYRDSCLGAVRYCNSAPSRAPLRDVSGTRCTTQSCEPRHSSRHWRSPQPSALPQSPHRRRAPKPSQARFPPRNSGPTSSRSASDLPSWQRPTKRSGTSSNCMSRCRRSQGTAAANEKRRMSAGCLRFEHCGRGARRQREAVARYRHAFRPRQARVHVIPRAPQRRRQRAQRMRAARFTLVASMKPVSVRFLRRARQRLPQRDTAVQKYLAML